MNPAYYARLKNHVRYGDVDTKPPEEKIRKYIPKEQHPEYLERYKDYAKHHNVEVDFRSIDLDKVHPGLIDALDAWESSRK